MVPSSSHPSITLFCSDLAFFVHHYHHPSLITHQHQHQSPRHSRREISLCFAIGKTKQQKTKLITTDTHRKRPAPSKPMGSVDHLSVNITLEQKGCNKKKKLLLSSRQSHRHCSTSLSSLCFSPPRLASFFCSLPFFSLLFLLIFLLPNFVPVKPNGLDRRMGTTQSPKRFQSTPHKHLKKKKIAIYESWPAALFPQLPMTWYMMNDEYWSRHCNFKGELIEEKIEKVETPPLSRGRYIQYAHRIWCQTQEMTTATSDRVDPVNDRSLQSERLQMIICSFIFFCSISCCRVMWKKGCRVKRNGILRWTKKNDSSRYCRHRRHSTGKKLVSFSSARLSIV